MDDGANEIVRSDREVTDTYKTQLITQTFQENYLLNSKKKR
jgi:hypothetical protein